MGNDGGSIPKRRELVKEAARNPTSAELKETQKEQLSHKWSTCPISHKPLAKPVVSDCEGNLYNKDAILQYLLPFEISTVDKEEAEKYLQGRVKGLKDVVEVIFEVDPDQKNEERWICPVTLKALGPAVKAVYLVPCGHAFSLEAMKEMRGEQCLQCGQANETRDVVSILPMTEEEKDILKKRREALIALGLTHSLKKASGSGKKRKANGGVKLAAEEVAPAQKPDDLKLATKNEMDIPRSDTPQSGTSTPKISDGIKNAATANLTAKVLEEEAARKKRRLLVGDNENLKSLFTKGGSKQRDGDFMSRGFSIPADARHR